MCVCGGGYIISVLNAAFENPGQQRCDRWRRERVHECVAIDLIRFSSIHFARLMVARTQAVDDRRYLAVCVRSFVADELNYQPRTAEPFGVRV